MEDIVCCERKVSSS